MDLRDCIYSATILPSLLGKGVNESNQLRSELISICGLKFDPCINSCGVARNQGRDGAFARV